MTKRIDREGPIHRDIVQYLAAVLPKDCIVHFCKGEINKRGANIARELHQAKLKGAKKGFPDLIVLTFTGAYFLEVKAPGNYPDKDQRELHDAFRSLGFGVAVVRSVEDAREALAKWHIGTVERAT